MPAPWNPVFHASLMPPRPRPFTLSLTVHTTVCKEAGGSGCTVSGPGRAPGPLTSGLLRDTRPASSKATTRKAYDELLLARPSKLNSVSPGPRVANGRDVLNVY